MRILCLILASDTELLYRRFQHRWRTLATLCPEVTCLFYKARPEMDEPVLIDGDTIWVRSPETLDTVYAKTLEAFRAVLPTLDTYSFVVRSNLSTVIDFPQLLDLCATLPTTECCAGFPGGILPSDEVLYNTGPKLTFPAGNGFILSPDLVRRLVDEHIPRVIQDDVTIGVALRKWDIPIRALLRVDLGPQGWYTQTPPNPSSDLLVFYRAKTEDRDYDLREMDTLINRLYRKA